MHSRKKYLTGNANITTPLSKYWWELRVMGDFSGYMVILKRQRFYLISALTLFVDFFCNFYYTIKYNYSIWSKKKEDRCVKRVKSYSKWSENLLLRVKVYSISSKFHSFYRAIPFLLHISYSVVFDLWS